MKLTLALLVVLQIVVLSLAASSLSPFNDCNICTEQLELGIVLDSSSSISREDFREAKDFLEEYLRHFQIGQTEVRVSLITYGRTIHPEDAFNLTTYNSNQEVYEALELLPHHATTYTNTNDAIRFSREMQLNDNIVRPGVAKVTLVITDGNSQEFEKTAAEAKRSRWAGIYMFAIGVGPDVDEDELIRIAGDRGRADRVTSYDKLKTITAWLAELTCISID